MLLFINLIEEIKSLKNIYDKLLDFISEEEKELLDKILQDNINNIEALSHLHYDLTDINIPNEDIDIINLPNDYKKIISILLRKVSNILSSLQNLKKSMSNMAHKDIIQDIINDYFVHYTLINNLNSKSINTRGISIDEKQGKEISIKIIKKLLDYEIYPSKIISEYSEAHDEDNPEYTFYEYIFETKDSKFKCRVSKKDGFLFYLQHSKKYCTPSENPFTKEDSLLFAQEFINKKYPSYYNKLVLDKDYVDTCSHSGKIEYYVFKYNLINNQRNVDLSKGIYITVDTTNKYLCELIIFY